MANLAGPWASGKWPLADVAVYTTGAPAPAILNTRGCSVAPSAGELRSKTLLVVTYTLTRVCFTNMGCAVLAEAIGLCTNATRYGYNLRCK